MRRFLLSLLVVSFFITACQQTPEPQPTRGLGGVTTDQQTRVNPTITLSETRGGPNTTVLVSGEHFPSETFVEIRLGTAAGIDPYIHAQPLTDDIGSFATSLTMPTLWPDTLPDSQAELVVQAQTLTEPALTAQSFFTLDYSDAFQSYTDEVGGFTLLLPQGWQVSQPQSTPLGTMFLVGREPLVPGDPAVSTILISEGLTPIRAAEQLVCGGGCLEEIRLERLDWDGQLLYKTPIVSEGSPTLQWYFFPQEKRLVYWSLHDPVTFKTLTELFPTFDISDVAVAAVEATITPTVEPSPTAEPEPTTTPTPAVSITPDLDANITADAGPVQATSAFLLAMLRMEIFTVAEAQPFLESAYYQSLAADESLLDLLQLSEMFEAFNVVREQEGGVKVRLELTQPDGETIDRYATLVRGEDDNVWHITSITAAETGTAVPTATGETTLEATPEATAEVEGEATVTPEVTVTEEAP